MSNWDLIIFWHRRDLRLSDHQGLTRAREYTSKVVGIFCFDPGILEKDSIAPARIKYLLGSLAAFVLYFIGTFLGSSLFLGVSHCQ